jgi:hypothetical protein
VILSVILHRHNPFRSLRALLESQHVRFEVPKQLFCIRYVNKKRRLGPLGLEAPMFMPQHISRSDPSVTIMLYCEAGRYIYIYIYIYQVYANRSINVCYMAIHDVTEREDGRINCQAR